MLAVMTRTAARNKLLGLPGLDIYATPYLFDGFEPAREEIGIPGELGGRMTGRFGSADPLSCT
jgi:hypothetical protein